LQSFASVNKLIVWELTILSGYFPGEMITMIDHGSSYGRTLNKVMMTMVKLRDRTWSSDV